MKNNTQFKSGDKVIITGKNNPPWCTWETFLRESKYQMYSVAMVNNIDEHGIWVNVKGALHCFAAEDLKPAEKNDNTPFKVGDKVVIVAKTAGMLDYNDFIRDTNYKAGSAVVIDDINKHNNKHWIKFENNSYGFFPADLKPYTASVDNTATKFKVGDKVNVAICYNGKVTQGIVTHILEPHEMNRFRYVIRLYDTVYGFSEIVSVDYYMSPIEKDYFIGQHKVVKENNVVKVGCETVTLEKIQWARNLGESFKYKGVIVTVKDLDYLEKLLTK